MPRTNTVSRSFFDRPAPAAVTYAFPPPGSNKVTITVPPESTWSTDLHWHEEHTEFIQVIQGRALVTLGDKVKAYGAEDGVICIEKFALHEWKRVPNDDSDTDLVVQEWTFPPDGEKEVFFRNLNSIILDAEKTLPWSTFRMDWWIEWQIMSLCHGMDNFPVYVTDSRTVTHVFLFIAAWLGILLGISSRYREYTPTAIKLKPSYENEKKLE